LAAGRAAISLPLQGPKRKTGVWTRRAKRGRRHPRLARRPVTTRGAASVRPLALLQRVCVAPGPAPAAPVAVRPAGPGASSVFFFQPGQRPEFYYQGNEITTFCSSRNTGPASGKKTKMRNNLFSVQHKNSTRCLLGGRPNTRSPRDGHVSRQGPSRARPSRNTRGGAMPMLQTDESPLQ